MEEVSTKYYKQLTNTDGIVEVRVQIAKNQFRLLGFAISRIENSGSNFEPI